MDINLTTNGRVLCFGELLLRICPDVNNEWLRDNKISVYVAGAEANVATDLALWEIPASYVTAFPDNFLSEELIGYFKMRRIDVSHILLQGERMGIFYLPKGKDLKNVSVIYDRKDSAFSRLQPGTIDWENILTGVTWLHVSAITPALGNNLFEVCKEAFEVASKQNISISFDLNYRAKLWQYGKQPVEIVPELVQYCDVVMGNIWSAEKMLGIEIDGIQPNASKENYLEQASETSKKIIAQFPKVKIVANTFRFDHGEKGINYYGTLYADDKSFVSKEYVAEKIIDKVGSGDCFMAGLIYGFFNKYILQETLEFASAAAFTKLFVESDTTTKTVVDIKECIANTYAAS